MPVVCLDITIRPHAVVNCALMLFKASTELDLLVYPDDLCCMQSFAIGCYSSIRRT